MPGGFWLFALFDQAPAVLIIKTAIPSIYSHFSIKKYGSSMVISTKGD
jgi:hypothetical protein